MERHYWTLQTLEAWEYFIKQGFIAGSSEFAEYSEQYSWMMNQMRSRLLRYEDEYPVWVWLKKPDMRTGGHFRKGTKCVWRLSIL